MGSLFEAALMAAGQNPAPGGRAYATSAQSVPNNADTGFLFGAVDYDTSGTGALVSIVNNSLVANRTGLWYVSFCARYATNASTGGERRIGIYRNGSLSDRICGANSYATYPVLSCGTTIRLAAGDYVRGVLYQSVGAALSLDLTIEPASMSFAFLGPA